MANNSAEPINIVSEEAAMGSFLDKILQFYWFFSSFAFIECR